MKTNWKRISALALLSVVQACGSSYDSSYYPNNSTMNTDFADYTCATESRPPRIVLGKKDEDNPCKTPDVSPSSVLVADAGDRLLVTVPPSKTFSADAFEISRLAYLNALDGKLLEFKCTRLSQNSFGCAPSCEQAYDGSKDAPPSPCAPVKDLKLSMQSNGTGTYEFRVLSLKNSKCNATAFFLAGPEDDKCVSSADKTSKRIRSRRISTAYFFTLNASPSGN